MRRFKRKRRKKRKEEKKKKKQTNKQNKKERKKERKAVKFCNSLVVGNYFTLTCETAFSARVFTIFFQYYDMCLLFPRKTSVGLFLPFLCV